MTSKSRLPSPSLIVALMALVMACAGTATAASLISGKQIKKNTVTSKQIKNRSLRTKDLHASAVRALKGRKGDPGAPGLVGAVGPSDVYSARAASPTPANNTAVLSLDVPAGSYLVTAKAMLLYDDAGPGLSEFECRLVAGTASDRSRSTMDPFTRDTVPFQLAFQSAGGARISLVCNGGNIKVEDRSISAVRVGALH
jgi:hypothetical protein